MIPFLAPVAGWAAKSVLMQSPVGGLLKRVPPRVWKILLLALLAGLAIFLALKWHGGKVEDLKTTAFNAGYAKRVAEENAEVRRRAQRDVEITAPIRRKTDETIRNAARHADALRVRGPGAAAACVDPAAAGPGGRDAGSGAADAAVDRVPGEGGEPLIALPFAPTIDFAEICTANLAEVKAWREQREKLEADRAKDPSP